MYPGATFLNNREAGLISEPKGPGIVFVAPATSLASQAKSRKRASLGRQCAENEIVSDT